MRILQRSLTFLILLIAFLFIGCEEERTLPAYDVLERTIGNHADKFKLVLLETDDKNDWFRINAKDGRVIIEGNSQVALCKGAYKYLKEMGIANISWEGNTIDIPEQIPDYTAAATESSFKYRMYLNACAFGYNTVWWDWERWEKEIDWMALHGINNPTALMGQEAVWQEVWSEFGIENDELKDYFAGPAFLPWSRMGNLNKHGGPLPQSWIEHEKELHKKMITRMKELGMSPIVQAFSGYVPKIVMEKYPDAKVHTMKLWSGFDASNGSFMLDPKDPLFKKIGKRFIEKYQEIYGEAEFFLADPFNEMKPPVSEDNKYEELAEYGKAIYSTISEDRPDAKWVMQGWLFGHDTNFWTPEAVKAFLSEIPKDKIIIQNYGEDRYPIWKKLDAFYGYDWQYGFVHTYGGTNAVFGDFNYYRDQTNELLGSTKKGSLKGFGIMAEAVENNSTVWEYMYDIPWGATNKPVEEWLTVHLKSRYGKLTPEIESAWDILNSNTYNVKYWDLRWKFAAGTYLHNKRPTSDMAGFDDFPGNPESLQTVINTYLSEIGAYDGNESYFHDLIEFSRHFMAYKADTYLVAAIEAYKRKDYAEGTLNFDKCKELLLKLDRLLLANDLSLSKWCKAAVSSPGTAEDKLLYLQNAKTQITIWGGSGLKDYASKEWSGMVKDFYIPRWQMFFDEMKSSGDNFDEKKVRENIKIWEEKWAADPEMPEETLKLENEEYLELIRSVVSD